MPTIGAEGLKLNHRSELLLADSALHFAAACSLGAELTARTWVFVKARHTLRSVLSSIRAAHRLMPVARSTPIGIGAAHTTACPREAWRTVLAVVRDEEGDL
jgi:hypothetical protein